MSAKRMAMAAARAGNPANRGADWPEKLIRPIRDMHPLPKMRGEFQQPASLLVEIPAAALRHTFETQPDFALPFVAALAANSRRQCSRLERSRLKRARDRVLHYLVCESMPGSPLALTMPLSSWAVELGLEPETLYRTLRELEQEGLISRNRRAISLASSKPLTQDQA
jgi:hypothetical protein